MKKDEWVAKSIEERKRWYIKEIEQLLDTEKNDSSSRSPKDQLKTIKMRMAFDNTPSKERTTDTGNDYYRTIYKAYKALPNFEMDREEWPAALNKAKEHISGTNS